MSSSDTMPPIKISKARELTMPLALLVTLLVAAAVGYAKWNATEDKVERHSGEINALQSEARQTREILIRIDENVKDMRRAQRRDESGRGAP